LRNNWQAVWNKVI